MGLKGLRAIEYGAWLLNPCGEGHTPGRGREIERAPSMNTHPLEDIFANAVELFQKAGGIQPGGRNGEAERSLRSGRIKAISSRLSAAGRSRLRHWLTGIPCVC